MWSSRSSTSAVESSAVTLTRWSTTVSAGLAFRGRTPASVPSRHRGNSTEWFLTGCWIWLACWSWTTDPLATEDDLDYCWLSVGVSRSAVELAVTVVAAVATIDSTKSIVVVAAAAVDS